jgi:hypothetical protein
MNAEYNTPSALNAPPEHVFHSAIKNRETFSSFVEKVAPIIMKRLIETRLYITKEKLEHISWIGGSRSWKHWYDIQPRKPSLTQLEKIAITPGNFDIFFACNSLQNVRDISCILYDTIHNILDDFSKDESIVNQYFLQVQKYGFNINNKGCFFDDPQRGESFPGYSYLVTIHDRSSMMRSQTRTAPNFEGKLLMYFEVFHFPNVALSEFSRLLIFDSIHNYHFLNEFGILLFNQMIDVARKDKGLPVDILRHVLLMRHVRETTIRPLYPHFTEIQLDAMIYKELSDVYTHLFGKDRTLYDENILHSIKLKYVRNRSSNINKLIDDFDKWIIMTLRPYVNALIAKIDQHLASTSIATPSSPEQPFIFVVGGDAMRRYKYDISETKDIDVKLYVPSKMYKTKAKMEQLHNHIIKYASILTQFLIHHKRTILKSNAPFGVNDLENGITVQIQQLSKSANNNQFRLRRIDAHQEFPIDLYSIDYRCKLNIMIDGKKNLLNYDIPILDIVIERNETGKQKSDLVQYFNGLPIANMQFLLDDIHATYLSKNKYLMRIWNNKQNKDRKRYTVLKTLFKNKNDTNVATSTEQELEELGAISQDAVGELNRPQEDHQIDYYQAFLFQIASDKKWHKVKHKLPFDQLKIKNLTDQMKRARSPASHANTVKKTKTD